MTTGATRATVVALLILVAVFGAGLFAGTRLNRAPAPPPPVMPGAAQEVTHQLGLTPDQQERVDAIVDRWNERTGRYMDTVQDELSDMIESATAEIQSVLTDQQRLVFDSLIAVERNQLRMRRPR